MNNIRNKGGKYAPQQAAYKLWLGQSTLGKSCGFPKAGFYLERFDETRHKSYTER
ncbi:hypothetical protein [Gelidibacter mesophilus]|uniref:hypothetical protein n=1 Tax=Gelidibacter mesophilus TaxID=169050 RepID=UPI00040E9E28|nr:hypothetical protein [Gelidibacter mesophilus]